MENRFLGLIENSIKEHWDLPAFSDYNGHTFHYKDGFSWTELLQLGDLFLRDLGLWSRSRAYPT